VRKRRGPMREERGLDRNGDQEIEDELN